MIAGGSGLLAAWIAIAAEGDTRGNGSCLGFEYPLGDKMEALAGRIGVAVR
jgi:hypothetical protein